MSRTELTYEEFCALPLDYVLGMSGDKGARRMYRNDAHGIQREVHTKRKRAGDIYSGWKDAETAYFLDGDPREFSTAAELYVAYMEAVCGVGGVG